MFSICLKFGIFSSRRVCTSAMTGVELSKVVEILEEIAPINLAEGWDNVGLLVEPSPPHVVKNVMLTNDLTLEVMKESIEKKADMVVSYHPPIFRPLKRITTKSWKEQLVIAALENKVAIYSSHTASDAVQNGVNDWLASGFGELKDIKPIKHKTCPGAGGMLGLMPSVCGSIPSLQNYFGNDLQLVTGTESGAIALLKRNTHIYQELCELGIPSDAITYIPNSEQTMLDTGAGRLCVLKEPASLEAIIEKVKAHLKLKHLRLGQGSGKTLKSDVNSIALCAGSGSSVLSGCEADVYLTGEMSHHEVLDATQNGKSVILCEHSNTERGYLMHLKITLEAYLQKNEVNILVSTTDRDPLEVI